MKPQIRGFFSYHNDYASSGECADEVFGGYPWFYREDMINSPAFPWAPKPEVRMEWLSPQLKAKFNPYDYVQQRYHETLAEVPRLPGEAASVIRILDPDRHLVKKI